MDFKLDHFRLYDVQPWSPGLAAPSLKLEWSLA